MNQDHLFAVDSSFWVRALMNDQMFCGAFTLTSVGAPPKAQLLNPAGSGKNVYLAYCDQASTSSYTLSVTRYDTALSTLRTTVTNMNLGAAAPVAEVRQATVVGATIGTMFLSFRSSSGGPMWFSSFDSEAVPIRLTPGMGMLLEANSSFQTVTGHFYWAEIPVRQA